ncbi:MAG TPA: hypothetical protein VES60_06745 [Nakamurella sp.]|nr:hypothetical protein [Nakamurella sp.]
MTITPSRARGLFDASTGDLVVITQQRISWRRRGPATMDITPGFDWTCVAAGGGAVAVAGADSIEWTGPDGSCIHSAAPASGVCRLAVAGRLVAGVTREGLLTVWESLDADPVTMDIADAVVEPEEVAVDGRRLLVTAWGWQDEHATLAAFDWRPEGLRPVIPAGRWPAPATGVVLGLADGVLGIGGTDALTLVSTGGDVLGTADLPGLERVAGSAEGVGWVRSAATGGGILVGWGTVTGSGDTRVVDLVAEQSMPGGDPFPEFTVSDGALVLAEGVDAHRLVLHRLTGQGWLDPEAVRPQDEATE